jgi:hypothetical protein
VTLTEHEKGQGTQMVESDRGSFRRVRAENHEAHGFSGHPSDVLQRLESSVQNLQRGGVRARLRIRELGLLVIAVPERIEIGIASVRTQDPQRGTAGCQLGCL